MVNLNAIEEHFSGQDERPSQTSFSVFYCEIDQFENVYYFWFIFIRVKSKISLQTKVIISHFLCVKRFFFIFKGLNYQWMYLVKTCSHLHHRCSCLSASGWFVNYPLCFQMNTKSCVTDKWIIKIQNIKCLNDCSSTIQVLYLILVMPWFTIGKDNWFFFRNKTKLTTLTSRAFEKIPSAKTVMQWDLIQQSLGH